MSRSGRPSQPRRRACRDVLAAVVLVVTSAVLVLAAPVASTPIEPGDRSSTSDVLLGDERPDAAASPLAQELAAGSERIEFLGVDTAELVRSLVGDLRVLSTDRDPDLSRRACRPIEDEDAAIDLLGEVTRFTAVEASWCDRRVPGVEVAGPANHVEWHGQVRDPKGDVLSSASIAVLLDDEGRAGRAVGHFQVQQTDLMLWPVDEVGGYALSEPVEHPWPEEGGDVGAGHDNGSDRVEGGRMTGNDQGPGGGSPQPLVPGPNEYDDPVPGDGAVEDGLSDNGGQPRAGGPSGNRVMQVLVGYASGVTNDQAALFTIHRTAQTNQSFITSNMPIRAEGFGPLSADYAQHPSSMQEDLTRLAQPADTHMDDLETFRSVGQLDSIMLLVPNTMAGACGLGYLATSVDGLPVPYAVAAVPTSGCDLTFTHELGHNFGAHHNPEHASAGTVFPWSYGHYVDGVARSVMSYSMCSRPRVAQWSDPHDSFVGHPGVASGLPYRDNDRTLTDTSWAMTEHGETDSNDFIWFRSATGHASHTVNSTTGNDMEAPYTPVAGDFNGDGRSDQLWYFPGRPRERVWYFGTTTGTYIQTSRDVQGDYTPIVGDFDGDGRDDLFWHGRGPTADSVWWGATSADFGTTAHVTHPTISGSTYRPVAGDFDGDGRDDILWYGPGAATDTIWWGNASRGAFSAGSSPTTVTIGNSYGRPFAGDVDGDGRDDIFLYAPGSGFDALWHGRAVRSEIGPAHQTSVTVNGTYTPLAGDLDGDGDDDVLWYGKAAVADSIWWGQASFAGFAGQSGTPSSVTGTYEATIGDFNGDGFADPYWFAFG